MTTDPIERSVGEVLGIEVVSTSSVSGGDVAEARRVVLADGDVVFAKTHAAPPVSFFDTEATGLGWLRDAAAADRLVDVPRVLAVRDDVLVLEWIDVGAERGWASTEATLGRGLAGIHRASSPGFGRSDRRTTGSRALPNEPQPSWPEFYASQRLIPLARLALDEGALPASSIQRIERVAGSLDRVGAADEPAVQLHGDLWAGNRLVDRSGRNWLIDPAAHGGHREFDLAMMRLFGGFGDDCFAAYNERSPLADGWRDRVPLHQLAPLVVHAIKFGGGYGAAVERALDASLRLV
ncbi:MAG: fructosamine kinase family protein [Ilumatobacter sp.]